jgi:hypothetical protein
MTASAMSMNKRHGTRPFRRNIRQMTKKSYGLVDKKEVVEIASDVPSRRDHDWRAEQFRPIRERREKCAGNVLNWMSASESEFLFEKLFASARGLTRADTRCSEYLLDPFVNYFAHMNATSSQHEEWQPCSTILLK